VHDRNDVVWSPTCRIAARDLRLGDEPRLEGGARAAVGQHESARRNGPIELGIRFGVSPQRNWVTLWKPAIDALGGILGDGDRPWHPRDDRISVLMLERQLRPELRWDVELDVWWAET
jgi:hypothetical protein